MPDALIEYQFRLRNADDDDDELVVTSVRGGTNPYLSDVPQGDGASFDPLTGKVTAGAFTVRIVDPITSGTSRLFTSITEDADERQQLGHRKAFIEFREDGGAWEVLYAGRVAYYGLASDIEWEVTVGDWMQAEHEALAFSPALNATIADFLARWPTRGCLFGGPVTGGILGLPAKPGWQMRVVRPVNRPWDGRLEPVYNSAFGPLLSVGRDVFDISNWAPGGKFEKYAPAINSAAQSLWTPANFPLDIDVTKVTDLIKYNTGWSGLVLLIGPDTGRVAYRPLPPTVAIRADGIGDGVLLSTVRGYFGAFFIVDTQSPAIANGSIVQVRCLTIQPTKVCPIYYTGHPVDLIVKLLGEINIPVNTASVEVVRAAIGAHSRITIRVTSQPPLGQFLESVAYGVFGIGARTNSDAEMELFVARRFPNTLPAVTISDADVVDGSVKPFALDASEAIRKVSLSHRRYTIYKNTPDSIEEYEERFERENDDPGSTGSGEATFNVPGMIHFADGTDIQLFDWASGLAHEIFDRYGRGPIGAEMMLKRGGAGDGVQLGQELLIDVSQVVNRNKRIGDDPSVSARAMQIVHLTPTLGGTRIRLVDSGPNAQPLSTKPTLSIDADADQPRNVAVVTITNAAALNAVHYAVRLQVAVTDGSAPSSDDYTDVAFFEKDEVPEDEYKLPAIFADRTVYVRARSEQPGHRPSDWGTEQSVALDALDAPTDLVATPDTSDGTKCLLEWTAGDANSRVEVLLMPQGGDADDARLVEVLLPGSTQYILEDLIEDFDYTAIVRVIDDKTGDRSTAATVDFTSNDTTPELTRPRVLTGWSMARKLDGLFLRTHGAAERNGIYGIGAVSTDLSADIEVWESVEDAPSAGTFGDYVRIGRIPSNQTELVWTVFSSVAPNDGKYRSLKVRHVRERAENSEFTNPVLVMPWTYVPLPPVPVDNLALSIRLQRVSGADNVNYAYVRVYGADPEPQGVDSVFAGVYENTDAVIDPIAIITTGVTIGTPTSDLTTTGYATVKIARPNSGDGSIEVGMLVSAIDRADALATIVIEEKDAVPASVDSVTVALEDAEADTVRVTASITGDFHHMAVSLNGGPFQLPGAGETTSMVLNAAVLLGYDLDPAGGNTRTITATAQARDAIETVLDSNDSAPTDFAANDDY